MYNFSANRAVFSQSKDFRNKQAGIHTIPVAPLFYFGLRSSRAVALQWPTVRAGRHTSATWLRSETRSIRSTHATRNTTTVRDYTTARRNNRQNYVRRTITCNREFSPHHPFGPHVLCLCVLCSFSLIN